MATIALTTMCPECTKNKKINRLMQHLGEDEVFCKEGHKFASLESTVPVAAAARKRAAAAQAEPVEAPTAVAVADPPPNLEEMSPLAMFDDEDSGKQSVSAEVAEEQAAPIDAEYVEEQPAGDAQWGEIPEATGLAHAAPRTVEVVPGSVKEVEGKNLELRVIIPEEFVSSLRATAENLGKAMEEYFSEVVQAGFSNGWFW